MVNTLSKVTKRARKSRTVVKKTRRKSKRTKSRKLSNKKSYSKKRKRTHKVLKGGIPKGGIPKGTIGRAEGYRMTRGIKCKIPECDTFTINTSGYCAQHIPINHK
jgi:hypothetical protein